MKKKQLEVENNFLKLQLNVIADLLKDFCRKNDAEKIEAATLARYKATRYQECADFIRDHDLPYNFYNKTISI